jgi:hypothetical protein
MGKSGKIQLKAELKEYFEPVEGDDKGHKFKCKLSQCKSSFAYDSARGWNTFERHLVTLISFLTS